MQYGELPVLRCRDPVSDHFLCRNCGHRLIEGYLPESFIAVRIRCFRCAEVSETPSLAPGELVPTQLLNMGATGEFLVEGPIDYNRGVAMTVDAEIVRSNLECSPNRSGRKWSFGESMLIELERDFELYSGLSCQKLLPKLERYQRSSTGSAMDAMPLVWALEHLRGAKEKHQVNLDDPVTNAALTRALLFGNMTSAWSRHPRFSTIAGELANPGSFHHTIGQFAFAGYLFNAGNRITFSVQDTVGDSKPDLYFRPAADEQLFVEVKAPRVLVWNPNTTLTPELVTKKVRELLASSRQINRQKPGLIAIMVNHPDPNVAQSALLAAKRFLKVEGRRKGSLAAVSVVHWPGALKEGGAIRVAYEVQSELNPHWDRGDNPVRTTYPAPS